MEDEAADVDALEDFGEDFEEVGEAEFETEAEAEADEADGYETDGGAGYEADEADEDEADEDEAEPDKGPLKFSDLSDERKIEVTVDGEKVVVSEKELAQGYTRQETFHRRLNALHEERKSIVSQAQQVQQESDRVKRSTINLLQSPEQLDRYMETYFPEQWDEAVKIALTRMVDLEQRSEQEKLEYYRQRDRRLYEARLKHEQAKHQTLHQEKERARLTKEAADGLAGPMRTVMADAGYPDMSQEEKQTFLGRVSRALTSEQGATGQNIIPEDDVREIIQYQLVRTLGPERAGGKAPPKPKAVKRSKRPKQARSEAIDQNDLSWILDMS